MNENPIELRQERKRVFDHFEAAAHRQNIDLNGLDFDNPDHDKVSRICFQRAGRRIFMLDMNESGGRGNEAIISRSGAEYQNLSMTIFISRETRALPAVWNLYASWIHLNKNFEEMERMADDFDEHRYGG